MPNGKTKASPQPTSRISVVATVRNEISTIRAFVGTLLAQTLRPDEIIIVDGASTDGTREVLGEFAETGRIRLLSRDCNIAQGRNLGIRQARNELVAITDAGCRVDPTWLQKITESFESEEQPDVVAGNFAFDYHSHFEQAVVLATFSPARESTPTATYYPSSRSVAFRKSAWKAAGGYPEWLYAAEDTLLNIRLRQLGYKFVFCKEAIVHWRPRGSWRKLAKQRFNFARGNARVGFETSGSLTNIQFHAAALILIALGAQWWPSMIAGVLIVLQHVRRHLWRRAIYAKNTTGRAGTFFRVLAVMEFVRIVNIFGFIAGRLDRLIDPSFKQRLRDWMGIASLDELGGVMGTGGGSRMWPSTAVQRIFHIFFRSAELLTVLLFVAALGAIGSSGRIAPSLAAIAWVASGCAGALILKSLYDFSYTGPPLRREILRQYRVFSLLALARLGFWAWVLCAAMATCGVLLYGAATLAANGLPRFGPALAAGAAGILLLTVLQFCRHLLYVPGSIAASYHYRGSRLYPLWRRLTPARLRLTQWALGAAAVTLFAASACRLALLGEEIPAIGFVLLALVVPLGVLALRQDPRPARRGGRRAAQPNILMIGSDTLRADRLVAGQYPRTVAPFIESLARAGTPFSTCYVPCARTAPSLLSLLTGTWPHRHGIRDNFVGEDETRLPFPALASLLARQGYRTAAVSDWCGGDLGKFPLGFEIVDLPTDQWNVKYLIRQGPKDLRLLVSLFTHNRFGKRFLPELYYLAGIPLTRLVGRDARTLINRFAAQDAPFFLNVFMSTTHPPFGSEYPYYTLWANKDYAGASKFVMAGVTDPWEIIRRQGDSKKEFDLEQILALYDGCVRNFDDEVKRIVEHLRACDLADNTIIVIYSDHGMEFFERDTWGQGNSVLTDASARVPLIIVDPRRASTGSCQHVVRSIDVAPTLLELAGAAAPRNMDGVSLVPYLNSDAVDLNLSAFNETGIWLTDLPGMPADHLRYPNLLELLEIPNMATGTLALKREYREPIIKAKDRMVRRGPWKLTYQPTTTGPLYALFNVAVDPGCQHNLAQAHPKIVRELSTLLDGWIAGLDERQECEGAPQSPPINSAADG